MSHTTFDDDLQMAGPRLAIRVAELMQVAASKSGLKQSEIAARLGVGESRVSQILNGDGNLHIATVARVFAALDCHVGLHAFNSDGEEVRILPRRKPRRKIGPVTYVHPVEQQDGTIVKVISYTTRRVEGRPVDYAMELDDVPEKDSVVEYELDFLNV